MWNHLCELIVGSRKKLFQCREYFDMDIFMFDVMFVAKIKLVVIQLLSLSLLTDDSLWPQCHLRGCVEAPPDSAGLLSCPQQDQVHRPPQGGQVLAGTHRQNLLHHWQGLIHKWWNSVWNTTPYKHWKFVLVSLHYLYPPILSLIRFQHLPPTVLKMFSTGDLSFVSASLSGHCGTVGYRGDSCYWGHTKEGIGNTQQAIGRQQNEIHSRTCEWVGSYCQ